MATSQLLLNLCSDDTPTDFSTDNLEKLKHKHPLEHNKICIPPSPDGMMARQVSEDEVLDAIWSFHASSAAGPDEI